MEIAMWFRKKARELDEREGRRARTVALAVHDCKLRQRSALGDERWIGVDEGSRRFSVGTWNERDALTSRVSLSSLSPLERTIPSQSTVEVDYVDEYVEHSC